MLKGLKEYIDKHGEHFTKELAEDVLNTSTDRVITLLNKEVWYNVSDATIGDILYLYKYSDLVTSNRNKVKFVINVVNDVNSSGIAFSSWLGRLIIEGRDFDFQKYV